MDNHRPHDRLTRTLATAESARNSHHTMRHGNECDCPGRDTLEAILDELLYAIDEWEDEL